MTDREIKERAERVRATIKAFDDDLQAEMQREGSPRRAKRIWELSRALEEATKGVYYR